MERNYSTELLDKLDSLKKPISAKLRVHWNLDNPNRRGISNGNRLISFFNKPTWQDTLLDIFVTQKNSFTESFEFPDCSNLETMEVGTRGWIPVMMYSPKIPSLKELSLNSPAQGFQISPADLPHLKKLLLYKVHKSCLPNGINAPGLSVLVIKESKCKIVGNLPSSQLTKLLELRLSNLSSFQLRIYSKQYLLRCYFSIWLSHQSIQYELCFELRTQNSQENSELGAFRFKQLPGDGRIDLSNMQYCLDVSGINFSNGGLLSITMKEVGDRIRIETEDGEKPEKLQLISPSEMTSFSVASN
ncbi:unnamed protein product [Ambrosiozyma monospora]|uniref:Unnamed protein product n=1 Tax=Ambrosiozyma monospora TaxID=43982 RepID=A0ACB5T4J7_AMBMO|nr:unnamed protein product [Ambrosiozyma monospora]